MTVSWGLFAYGVNAGVFAAFALVYLLLGLRRRSFDAPLVAFGVFSLANALSTAIVARLHMSSTVSEYQSWFTIFSLASLGGLVAIVVLVAVWTNGVPKPAMVVFAVASTVIGVLVVVLPDGLLVGEIVGLREVELFGDQFVVHDSTTSRWRFVLDVYLVGSLGLITVALVHGLRRERRAASGVLALTVAVMVLFSAYDLGVDTGAVDTPYLLPFGVLGTAAVGAVHLSNRSNRIEAALRAQTASLEETVVERTAALIESNRRLEGQVASQQRSARHLASLAEVFEASNELVDPSPVGVERSVRSVLEQLGTIMPAVRVELHLDRAEYGGAVSSTLSWTRAEPDEVVNSTADAIERDTTDVSASISIESRVIGALIARLDGGDDLAPGSAQYVELAAEHLGGLLHRLELIGLVVDAAASAERQRIARDLHDSVTQRMYSVSMIADAVASDAVGTQAELAEPILRIRELVLMSIAELRALLQELRPHAFDDTELPELLEELAGNLDSDRTPEIVCDLAPVPPMSTPIRTTIYRIAQESISNACRHAQAERVTITLDHDEESGVTTLQVRDDGVGFDPVLNDRRGAGLDNIRSRAASIDADLDVVSGSGTGTTVTLRHRVAAGVDMHASLEA